MANMNISNYTTVAGIKVDKIICAVEIRERVKNINLDMQKKFTSKKELLEENNLSL